MSSPRSLAANQPSVGQPPRLPPRNAGAYTLPHVLARKPVPKRMSSEPNEIQSIISSEPSAASLPTLSSPSLDIPSTPLSEHRTSLEDIQQAAKQRKLDKKLLDSISMADDTQVREALAEGVDIQAENNKPLILAVGCGAASIVQILLDEGVNLNASDGEDRVPILLAVEKGNVVVTTMLTEYGAYINISSKGWTPLHKASYQGDSVLVKYLLRHGADKEAQTHPNRRTALHMATLNSHAKIVEVLLDAGCNIHAESSCRRTALHLACCAAAPANYQCVNVLVDRGAKLGARQSFESGTRGFPFDGDTALHSAARIGDGSVVELLVNKGADVFARNRYGETAIDLAVLLEKRRLLLPFLELPDRPGPRG